MHIIKSLTGISLIALQASVISANSATDSSWRSPFQKSFSPVIINEVVEDEIKISKPAETQRPIKYYFRVKKYW